MPTRPVYRGGQLDTTTTVPENQLNMLLLQIKGQLSELETGLGREPIPVTYGKVRRIADGVGVLRRDIEDGVQSTVTITPGSTDEIKALERTFELLDGLEDTILHLEDTLLQPAESEILSRQGSTSTLELEFETKPLLKVLYYSLPRVRLERATQLFPDSPEAQAAYVNAVSSFLRRHLDTRAVTDVTLREVLRTIEANLPSAEQLPDTEQGSYLEFMEGLISRIPDASQLTLRTTQTGGGDIILPIRTPSQLGGNIGWLKAAIDTTAEAIGPQEKKGVVRFTNGTISGGSGTRKAYGGYNPTERNRMYLEKWKRGESIGFTMTASLKAKGLIPRESKTLKGKRVVSAKYK